MADRLFVAYKSPTQRIIEVALAIGLAILVAEAWHALFPGVSSSYVTVATLIAGFYYLPRWGEQRALRSGAARMSAADRDRRYLAEYGPIGTGGPRLASFAALPRTAAARRGRRRR